MSPANALKLEAFSGRSGIFITRTQVLERKEEVLWIERKPGEERDQYFVRVLQFADDRKQSVKYRKRGGNDLGVIKLAADPTKQHFLSVDVQGIPRDWDGEDVISFLQSEQWADVSVLNRRRAGRGVFRWTVKGKPPVTNLAGPWSYVDQKDDQWSVLVSRVAWNARQPESVSVRPPRHQPRAVEAPQDTIEKEPPKENVRVNSGTDN